MRVLGRMGLLVVLWLLAWGQLTVANVVSGTVVAAALLVAFPLDPRANGRLRLDAGGIARLAGHVVVQLVTSNVVVAREILRRRSDLRPGVIAHRLRQPSQEVVTVMSSVIALSPGTMTVDVDPDSTTICVHFLLLRDVDAARAGLARLEDLAVRAIGGPPPNPSPAASSSKESP